MEHVVTFGLPGGAGMKKPRFLAVFLVVPAEGLEPPPIPSRRFPVTRCGPGILPAIRRRCLRPVRSWTAPYQERLKRQEDERKYGDARQPSLPPDFRRPIFRTFFGEAICRIRLPPRIRRQFLEGFAIRLEGLPYPAKSVRFTAGRRAEQEVAKPAVLLGKRDQSLGPLPVEIGTCRQRLQVLR